MGSSGPLTLPVPLPSGEERHGEAIDRVRGLAERHYREIWVLLRRLGVAPSGVDDAAQQVFLVAAAKVGRIEAESERAFLVSVAVRTAANTRRAGAARKGRHSEDDPDMVASDAPGAEELLEQRRLRRLLDEALDTLPEDLRAAFVLFELEGLTQDEIAEALAIPRGTAASRLRRAREAFHLAARRLKARGDFQGGSR